MKKIEPVPAPAEDDIVMPKAKPATEELAPLPSNECKDPECGFTAKSWAGREMWACEKCGFQTFTKSLAEERAGRAL